MPSLDALNFGPTGAERFARNSGRSLSGESLGAIRYPSPFFDIAQTYLPSSFKSMLRWCRYYFLTNPLINAVCYKMAEYPVTDLVFDGDSDHDNNRWDRFFKETLHYKKFEIEVGLDYNTYGNAFVSIHFPFKKHLVCKSCKCAAPISHQKYVFREYKFVGACRRCSHHGEFDVRDYYMRSPREIRLIRWNPEYISIQHNEATGESRYYYVVPPTLANDVRMAKRHIIEHIPQVFIEALRKNKALLFSKQNIYHMQRPTIAQKDRGWGMPMILPVLKDTFYLQVLRKAQEAIAIEHIVPLRILFPQAASGSTDPYCVSLDTIVETRDGPLPASEIREGDYLKTHSGSWKPVEAVADREVRPGEKTYKFNIASLPAFPFTLSEEHPILACKKSEKSEGLSEPSWIFSKDLKKGDFVLYPTNRKTWETLSIDLSEHVTERAATEKFLYRRMNLARAKIYEYLEENGLPEFERGERAKFLDEMGWGIEDWNGARQRFMESGKIDRVPRFLEVTEELAYVVGSYAAEGHCSKSCPNLSLDSSETWFMDILDECLSSIGMGAPTRSFSNDHGGANYFMNDVILGEFLESVCGKGAAQKKLPRFIMEAPRDIALSALQGLFLGDGCNIATETRRVALKTISPHLAVSSRQLLLSMGYIPSVQKSIPSEKEIAKEPYYQVSVNGVQAEHLATDFGWKPFCKSRKNKVWSQCGFIRDGYVYLRIDNVSEDPVLVVRGFQIADDRSFCVVGVATHNSTINMTQWRDKVEQELVRWRLDNNYIPLLPVPIGQQTLGGDGRALMLSQEYRQWSEHIVAGMGVPIEFVFGGMQFSGSNVSMRILENHFLDVKAQRQQLILDFLLPNIGAFLDWTPASCHYKRFKMADDLQRSAFYMQLNQAGKLSDRSLLEDTDWDSSREQTRIEEERKLIQEGQRRQAIANANIQGEAQLVMAKYQMRAQKLMTQMTPEAVGQGMPAAEPMPGMGQPGMSPMAEGSMMNQQQGQATAAGQTPGMEIPPAAPQGPGGAPGEMPPEQQTAPGMEGVQSQLSQDTRGAGYDLMGVAQKAVNWLNTMKDTDRHHHLVKMQINNPHLYALVLPMLQQSAGAQQNSAAMPVPEQRPARRGPEAAQGV